MVMEPMDKQEVKKMGVLKYLVYEVQDGILTDLIAAFKHPEEAAQYCEKKRKEKQYTVKKEYYVKEYEE